MCGDAARYLRGSIYGGPSRSNPGRLDRGFRSGQTPFLQHCAASSAKAACFPLLRPTVLCRSRDWHRILPAARALAQRGRDDRHRRGRACRRQYIRQRFRSRTGEKPLLSGKRTFQPSFIPPARFLRVLFVPERYLRDDEELRQQLSCSSADRSVRTRFRNAQGTYCGLAQLVSDRSG